MELLKAIGLGLIQGLTEFLPISSSGHLVLFQQLLSWYENSLTFDIAVHFGTLLTILTIYFKSISKIAKEVITYPKHRQLRPEVYLFVLIVIASVPTAIIGFAFKDLFEQIFHNVSAVGVALCVTGCLLYLTKNKKEKQMPTFSFEVDKSYLLIPWWKAAIIGLTQGFAITPGISRSGSTIAIALLLNIDRQKAALFSFLISIPAICGAGLLQLQNMDQWQQINWFAMGSGVLTAYLSGLLGLLWVLKFLRQGRLQLFSYYLWFLGGGIILYRLLDKSVFNI